MTNILEILDTEIQRRHEQFLKMELELNSLKENKNRLYRENVTLKTELQEVSRDFIKYKKEHK